MKWKKITIFLASAFILLVFGGIWLRRLEKRPVPLNKQATPAGVVESGESTHHLKENDGEQEQQEEKIKKIIVKNENKELTLYWENLDMDNMGVYADYNTFAPKYSQVLNGHYYYLRHRPEDEDIYTIYQDAGEMVGKFEMQGDMEMFMKYKYDYYVSFECGRGGKISRVDTNREIDSITDEDFRWSGDLPYMFDSPLWLYDNYIFYYPQYTYDEETGSEHINDKYYIMEMTKAPIDNLADKTEVKIPDRIMTVQNYSNLIFVDGKIIYGAENKGKINLYSYDMEAGTELKIFSFKPGKGWESDYVKIQLDRDYIYCEKYLIPLSGGRIQEISDKKREIGYSYNEKYIYYIDKKFHVHRIDKKTKKNNIISQIKAMKVDATDRDVYIQKYNKPLFENKVAHIEEHQDYFVDEWDWYSCALYKMDLDGKNPHMIEEEVTEREGDWD